MRRTLSLSAVVLFALLGCLAFVREPGRWPAPERIPFQGEAADAALRGHSAAALGRLIREPQNTWSNLAFVVGGAWLIGTRRTRVARALGIPLIAVGIGSFLYHASVSELLRQFDVGAMFWLFVMVAMYLLSIVAPAKQQALEDNIVTSTIALCVVASLLTVARNLTLFGFKPISLASITGLTSAALLLTLAATTRRKESLSAALQLLGIVTTFGAAVFLQVSDRPGGTLCRPTALIQAHAVWHVLAAIAFVWAIGLLDASAGNGQSEPSAELRAVDRGKR
jgi:hypothetical protein